MKKNAHIIKLLYAVCVVTFASLSSAGQSHNSQIEYQYTQNEGNQVERKNPSAAVLVKLYKKILEEQTIHSRQPEANYDDHTNYDDQTNYQMEDQTYDQTYKLTDDQMNYQTDEPMDDSSTTDSISAYEQILEEQAMKKKEAQDRKRRQARKAIQARKRIQAKKAMKARERMQARKKIQEKKNIREAQEHQKHKQYQQYLERQKHQEYQEQQKYQQYRNYKKHQEYQSYQEFQDYTMRQKLYMNAALGYTFSTKKIDSENYTNDLKGAMLTTAGVGYKASDMFRSDILASYRGSYNYSGHNSDNEWERQKFSSISIMINGYFSPKSFDFVKPYFMAGIGISVNKAGDFVAEAGKIKIVGAQQNNLAWQVGAGILIEITKRANLDFEYKYVDLGYVTTKGIFGRESCYGSTSAFKGRFSVHEVSIGISYNF
jgi:opacity protein-like surface antigen